MTDKKRLDIILVDLNLAESREKARAFIMAGVVYVDNQKADKAGQLISPSANIVVRTSNNPFVSRGGLKLKKAMESFDIQLEGKTTMDIGASTGGFTDCMLQNGAKKVFAVDVGYGQLAWKLRSDSRVVNMERTNIRYVTNEQIGELLDFITVDVSFISLKLVLPVVFRLLNEDGEAICLIKPQFEAGREKVGKKGVVRELSTHIEVIENVISFAKENGFFVKGLDFSPVKGPEGNIEYLIYLSKNENNINFDIKGLAEKSHNILKELN